MSEAPDPKTIAQTLMPKWQFDFAPALSAVHAQMFDQMLTLGLTVQARLTIPASEQPRATGRSIDAPDYAACALVRAIRDLALSSDRIINQAKAASMWQTSNQYEAGDTNRIEELAEAVARRAIEPLPRALTAPAEPARTDTSEATEDGNTVPFPPRRARH